MVGDSDSTDMSSGAHESEPETAEAVNFGYSELLARVPAIVYVADAGTDGAWHYVSPQIEQILGYTPVQWCADPNLWLARLHPDDRDWVLAREQALSGAAPDSPALEYRLLHRDGRVVWIRDDAVLATDAGGALRWHGVLSDIT
ncbi:MAG: PAS domain-containing protein [Solirubrobacteraceae bacterium]